jgi:hypothetical protein
MELYGREAVRCDPSLPNISMLVSKPPLEINPNEGDPHHHRTGDGEEHVGTHAAMMNTIHTSIMADTMIMNLLDPSYAGRSSSL